MLGPAVILLGCFVAAGSWALPNPAPPSPSPSTPAPSTPHSRPGLKRLAEGASIITFGIGSGSLLSEEMRKRRSEFHDLDRMFAPNQLSRIGRTGQNLDAFFSFDPRLREEALGNAGLLVKYNAYKLAMRSQSNRILYVMTRDDRFLDCMIQETGQPFSETEHDSPANPALIFFAAEVCQLRGGRFFGIRYPRLEEYFPHREEAPEYSKAHVRARARARLPPSSNAFQSVQHGLSRMISRLSTGARRVEMAMEPRRWPKWEAEPKPLLLEGHY
ncbi:MAG: hypothetical protein M1826_006675 [Phylliscum demangeonii]|nr:MAG: hypothetical protein M1826_006675 [Phylliscum demangeonii]